MTRSSSSFLTLNLILPPFFFVIIATLVLASFGKSLGIRNLYVKVLLRIFEVDIISNIYFSGRIFTAMILIGLIVNTNITKRNMK